MSAVASRFSSPRLRRRLLRSGGAVAAVGAVVFVVTVVWTGPEPAPIDAGNGVVQKPVQAKTVPFEASARDVGERFIETAVVRKDLAASWKLTGPTLRQDFTEKRWETGNIPVVPYPADVGKPARVKVEYSYANEVMFLILLEPKKGDPTKPQLFHLGLRAYGKGAKRHWLVDYWAPFGSPKIPLS